MHTYTNHSDTDLILLLKGDGEAVFDEIYRRYWKQLYNEAFRRLSHPELCEELVHDVFIDLWENRQRREIMHLKAYLFQAVRYQVIQQYNKIKSLPHFEEPLDHMGFSSWEADSVCFEKDLIARVEKWLETQPEKRRKILEMNYLNGMTTKEIAVALNISQKTVQNQLLNGQHGLRTDLLRFLVPSLLYFLICGKL